MVSLSLLHRRLTKSAGKVVLTASTSSDILKGALLVLAAELSEPIPGQKGTV